MEEKNMINWKLYSVVPETFCYIRL